MQLKGKVVLITGASRGIGEAFAQIFAEQGCNLVLCARSAPELKKNQQRFERLGIKCVTVVADASKKEDVKKVVNMALKTFGKIDILINNAGFAVYKPLINTTDKDYQETIDVNLKGVFLFCREIMPIMEQQGEGVIITVSSSAGKTGSEGLTIYCATKFAVEGFIQSLAQEVKNVKVCTVCPGPVNTKMYRDNSPGEDYSKLDKPRDIAERVLKLVQKGIENGASYNVRS